MLRLTWLGHSFFRITIDEFDVLVDPWANNPLYPKGYPLDSYDLIVVTHAHGDHVGEAADLLKRNPRARAVCVYEIGLGLIEEGVREEQVIGGNIGGPIDVGIGNIKVVLTPAAHSSQRGVATGAIIMSDKGRVYHAGDTGLTTDMGLYAEIYRPDVFLVPIGGHYTMDPLQAAYAVRMVKPKIAIPMHYWSFPVLYGDPEEFRRLVSDMSPDTRVLILTPGNPVELPI